jgi:hypothetical protein
MQSHQGLHGIGNSNTNIHQAQFGFWLSLLRIAGSILKGRLAWL